METSTTSASSVSAVPPAAGSSVSTAFLPLTLAPVTLVPSLNSIPCLRKILLASLRTSPSMPGRIWSRNSTTVTLAPSRRQTLPSSRPMTPPPMTTIEAGTLSSTSAPVESTMMPLALSTSTPGSGVTDEPVAMTIFFAVTVFPATSTLCASLKLAWPFSQSIWFFLNRNSMPPVRPLTASARCACMVGRSSSGFTLMPIAAIAPPAAAS